MTYRTIVYHIVLLFLLVACTTESSSTATPRVPISPTTVTRPTLENPVNPLDSAMVGQIISTADQTHEPLPNVTVRLAGVHWNENRSDGAFVIDESNSPTTITDANGYFTFADLEPRDYVIVIGDLYGQHVILSNTDGSARIFTLEEGRPLEIGVLEVDLTSAPSSPSPPANAYPSLSEPATSYP